MGKMSLLVLPLLFLGSCLFDIDDNVNEMETAKHLDNWELIWNDDFNNDLNDSNWTKIKRKRSDLPWQRFMSDNEACYDVKDGSLILRGILNNDLKSDTARYLTGGIRSTKTIEYGKVEVRAKIKKTQGAWPAIWMIDEKRNWPHYGGEIDILESINYEDNIHQTVHTLYSLSKELSFTKTTNINNKESFNTFGVIINPNEIVFLINNKVTYIYSRDKTIADDQQQFSFGDGHNMYLILSMQLEFIQWTGHVDKSQLPTEMEIDWVRFYKKKNENLPDY